MNRIIKFRAWDESRKEMITEFGLLKESMPQLLQNEEDGYIFCGHSQDNGDWTEPMLMQFTGLYDKNGKEIYEGDILISQFSDKVPTQICFGEFTCSTYETKDFATQIGFYWHELDGTKSIFGDSIYGNMDYCEVIGNIYENPELLKP